MELYEELFTKFMRESVDKVLMEALVDVNRIIELECYKALQKIKAVIEDDSLEDEECFYKIEEIVCIFESKGSSGGNRHDFS